MMTLKLGPYTAELSDDGRWSSRSERLAVFLNSGFPKELYPDSPSSGRVGASQMNAAHALMGGTVTWPAETQEDPTRVY